MLDGLEDRTQFQVTPRAAVRVRSTHRPGTRASRPKPKARPGIEPRPTAPATIDCWLDLANNPPQVGGWFNFEIRNYRDVPGDQAKLVIDEVRAIISSVAHLPPSSGYKPFDHTPFRLFLAVLETVPQGYIRSCIRCGKYFLVKRTDKQTCSPECANVARQMRYRERWRNYEQNRERNRAAREHRKKRKAKRRSHEFKGGPGERRNPRT